MATPETRKSAELQHKAVFFCTLGFVFQLTASVCNTLQYCIKDSTGFGENALLPHLTSHQNLQGGSIAT